MACHASTSSLHYYFFYHTGAAFIADLSTTLYSRRRRRDFSDAQFSPLYRHLVVENNTFETQNPINTIPIYSKIPEQNSL